MIRNCRYLRVNREPAGRRSAGPSDPALATRTSASSECRPESTCEFGSGSPVSRFVTSSISTAYLRSQFIEDSHAPARQPFRSAQHVSEVSPRTPARLLRVRARPTNRIGIPTRPFSHASRSFRLRSDTRPDSRHHDTDEFPF